jgi:ribosomal protein S20
MTTPTPDSASAADYARLAAELEQAELYEQRLRGLIVAVRDELANGNAERALSMLNEALNEIDNATDVVTHARTSARTTGGPER